ncbi:MAG TPA: hypothetical protein VFH68_27045 [Polyangia bacterium]|jgi:hypothetical protein|nr:hypothetical protein [Polyangia bacterium]
MTRPAPRPQRFIATAILALLLVMRAPRPAGADQPPARETALVAQRGTYSVGVFNPLRIAVAHRVELEAQPLVFLVAPHLIARVSHLEIGDRLRLTGEYGLSLPTLAMKLLQGHLFPSWDNGEGRVGWIVAPRAGIVASIGDPWLDVFTVRVDLTVGVVLSHTDTMPLDTYAPVELLFAPVTSGYRGRAGALYDRRLGRRWRARGYADLYLTGSGELHDPGDNPLRGSPRLTTRVGAGVDLALGHRLKNRLTFGVAWWNYYQHEIDPVTFETRRSNDVFPTIDFIWGN